MWRIWALAIKCKGLGEMIAYQDREPAFDERDVVMGLGLLIREIGEELETISKEVDRSDVRRAWHKARSSSVDSEQGSD